MAAEVARNAWGIVNHHQQQGVLELRWLPSTSDMTDDDFKVTLELFAEQAERTGAPFLLVDSTDFGHQFGEGGMEWRNQQIIPRYNASGTGSSPSTSPRGSPTSLKPEVNPSSTAPPRFQPRGSPIVSTRSTG